MEQPAFPLVRHAARTEWGGGWQTVDERFSIFRLWLSRQSADQRRSLRADLPYRYTELTWKAVGWWLAVESNRWSFLVFFAWHPLKLAGCTAEWLTDRLGSWSIDFLSRGLGTKSVLSGWQSADSPVSCNLFFMKKSNDHCSRQCHLDQLVVPKCFVDLGFLG